MLKTQNWVYLDLEKTGCTFLRTKLLSVYSNDYFADTRKHVPPDIYSHQRTLITIRDPYSYYFSLFSYGMMRKGGFRSSLERANSALASKIYSGWTSDSYSYFLEFCLSGNALSLPLPSRMSRIGFKKLPNLSWLPWNADLYTYRILRQIIPVSLRQDFWADCVPNLSKQSLSKNLEPYIPSIIIRTSSLNADFYRLYELGLLEFMGLPPGWQQDFPFETSKINSSSSTVKPGSDENLLSEYFRDYIKAKCRVPSFLLERAADRLRLNHTPER